MLEYLKLFWLNLTVSFRQFVEYLRVIFRYYSNLSFCKIDTYLIFTYLFHSPFRISKRFLRDLGETDIYTYGETPLTTLDQMAQTSQLTSHDTVFELGCGRGRTCFWLNQFIGCKVVGIDYVPVFIERANQIKEKFNLKDIQFREDNMLTTDLTGATVIYLYGTCLEDAFIEDLIQRFSRLPNGTKIITVSYSLLDYAPKGPFTILKSFPARFTWGTTDVYLHVLKSS